MTHGENGWHPLAGSLSTILEAMERGSDADDPAFGGVRTGYFELDQRLSGVRPGTLTIVGARPAMGKTSFVLGIASHVAANHGPALLVCPGMDHTRVATRMLSAEAQVDPRRLRTGQLLDPDWPRISAAHERLADAPLFVTDEPRITIEEIEIYADRMTKNGSPPVVVVVDHIQMLAGRSTPESRYVELGDISRSLKILARERHVPVVAVSGLSRQCEARYDKRPILTDLMGGGSLEEDADVVLFIYRDEVYNPETNDKGAADIIVAKHSDGAVGTSRLVFQDRFMSFYNAARGV